MAAPSLRGGGGGIERRRPPGAPLDRVTDSAVASRRSCAAPSRVWAVAVLLIAGVSAVGVEGVPSPDLHRLHLPSAVGRAGSRLYQSTMQYLMDQLAPSRSPDRLVARRGRPRPNIRSPHPLTYRGGVHNHKAACLGGVCVGPTAALLGVALLLKFAFLFGVTSGSSSTTTSNARHGNITNIITVQTTNTVTMDTQSGDQTQMQTQDMTETQDQDQDQDIYQDLYSDPYSDVDQSQEQTQNLDQEQNINQEEEEMGDPNQEQNLNQEQTQDLDQEQNFRNQEQTQDPDQAHDFFS